jgi:hypothetical protein
MAHRAFSRKVHAVGLWATLHTNFTLRDLFKLKTTKPMQNDQMPTPTDPTPLKMKNNPVALQVDELELDFLCELVAGKIGAINGYLKQPERSQIKTNLVNAELMVLKPLLLKLQIREA